MSRSGAIQRLLVDKIIIFHVNIYVIDDTYTSKDTTYNNVDNYTTCDMNTIISSDYDNKSKSCVNDSVNSV